MTFLLSRGLANWFLKYEEVFEAVPLPQPPTQPLPVVSLILPVATTQPAPQLTLILANMVEQVHFQVQLQTEVRP